MLCRLQGYLYTPEGQVVDTGRLHLTLQQDMVQDSKKIAPFTVTIDLSLTAGYVDVNLYPTEGASPSGLSYFVEYDPDPADTTRPRKTKDGYWSNYWAVPYLTAIGIGVFAEALRGEPMENFMPLSGSISGIGDVLTLGTSPVVSSKYIYANQTSGDNPGFRYNVALGLWQISNNGTVWADVPTSITGLSSTSVHAGDVTGFYDNLQLGAGVVGTAELATIGGLSAGTYGSASLVPVVTVDIKGRITAISTVAVEGGGGGGGTPSGQAGGDLSSEYPNPLVTGLRGIALSTASPNNGQVLRYSTSTFKWEPSSDGSSLTFSATNLTSGTIPLARITGLGNAQIDANAQIAWSKINKTGALVSQLSNDAGYLTSAGTVANFSGSLAGDVTGTQSATVLSTTGVTADTYGDATHVAQVTVDAKGRITTASEIAITDVPAIPHNLLDGNRHPDTTAGTVARGDLVVGIGGTPKWTRYALGANGTFLQSNGTDLIYSDDGSTLTDLSADELTSGTVPAGRFPAFTGDVTTTAGTVATTLANTAVSIGSYGAAGAVSTFTVDQKGRLTAAGQTSIQITESQITDGAILARVGGNETITGAWTYSATITANGTLALNSGSLTSTSSLSITPAGGLTLNPSAGNVTLSPSSGNVIVNPSARELSPLSGYQVSLGTLNKKYLAIYAGELNVETLVAQDTASTIGGRIIVSPTTQLITDLVYSATSMSVKHNNLSNGDIVLLQAQGKTEWLQVTSGPSTVTGGFSYTITRNLNDTRARDWYAGDAVVQTGQAGSGFLDLYSQQGVIGTALDYIYNYDAGATAFSVNYATSSVMTLFGDNANTAVDDCVYFGLNSAAPWANLYFNLTTAATYTATLLWEYWNGSSWTSFSPTASTDFKSTGVKAVTWGSLSGWAGTSVNGSPSTAFWVRVRISAFTSFATAPVQSTRRIMSKSQAFGPTVAGMVRNSSTFSDISERWAIGNLNGLYGYAGDVYGAGFGVPSATWLGIDATNGIRVMSGPTTTLAKWDTSGAITVGQVAASQSNVLISSGALEIRSNTTPRIRLASDGSGYLANSNIAWDTSGNLTVSGNATIAGWTIGSATLTGGNTTLNSAGSLSIKDTTFGNDGIQLQYNGGTPRFYAGGPGEGGGTTYVTPNRIAQVSAGCGTSQVSSLSTQLTIPSGSNKLLLVAVAHRTSYPTTVYWNTTEQLTALDQETNTTNARISVFYLKNPTSGTANIDVTTNATCYFVVSAAAYENVHQTATFGAVAKSSNTDSTTISNTVTATTDDVIFDAIAFQGGTSASTRDVTADASQTLITGAACSGTPGVDALQQVGKISQEAGAASVVMSWTSNYTTYDYAHLAVPLKAHSYSSGETKFFKFTGTDIEFRGTNCSLLAGDLTATSGTVGGWTLGEYALTGGNATLHNSGYIALGTGNDFARLDAADATYRLWVGHATAASAPFRVTKAGALTASNATITGSVTATSGSIGGWTLGATSLVAGSGATTVGLDSGGTNPALYAGSATPASAPFRVTNAGAMTASNANITGVITASSGSFTGGVSITGSGSLTAGTGVTLNTSGITLNSASAAQAPVYSDVAALKLFADSSTRYGALWGATDTSSGAYKYLFLDNVSNNAADTYKSTSIRTSSFNGTTLTSSTEILSDVVTGTKGRILGFVKGTSYPAKTPIFEILRQGDGPMDASARFGIGTESASGYFAGSTIDSGVVVVAGSTTIVGPATIYSSLDGAATLNYKHAGTLLSLDNTQTDLTFAIDQTDPYTAYIQHRHRSSNGSSYPIALNPAGGNVGIGVTGPSSILHTWASQTNDTSATQLRLSAGSDGTLGALYFILGTHVSATGGSRYAYMVSGDSVGYRDLHVGHDGATACSNVLIGQYDLSGSDGNGRLYIKMSSETDDGVVVKAHSSGRVYYNSSSLRYKTDLRPLDIDPDLVYAVTPKTFTRKGTGLRDIGLIAEDLDAVGLGDFVHYRDGVPDAIHYEKLSIVLLAALQALKVRVDDLERR